ncbi:hypothetical protein [Ferrimonas gelatinilytica]|uniref:DUF3575 domain-containing protein n=1 Tax=Ferrimonas gelatinilytica TaxID=1255257 RepID=A0ABP9RUN4_9GAMM
MPYFRILLLLLFTFPLSAKEHRLLISQAASWLSEESRDETSLQGALTGLEYHFRWHQDWSLVTGYQFGQLDGSSVKELPVMVERKIALPRRHSLYLQGGNQWFWQKGEKGLALAFAGGWQWKGRKGVLTRLGYQHSQRQTEEERSDSRLNLAVGWAF